MDLKHKIALMPQGLVGAAAVMCAALAFVLSGSSQSQNPNGDGRASLNAGTVQGDALQGTDTGRKVGPLAGGLYDAGPLEGAGPLHGGAPLSATGPAGVGGPIVTFAGSPPPAALQLISLPPGLPAIPPALPRDPLPDVSAPATASPSLGKPPPPSLPGDAPAPSDSPTTVCVTCGFIPPAPYQPIPPANNIVTCANVTCS